MIDEAAYVIDRYAKMHEQIATRSAHRQHACIFICQRYSQISPVIRSQCASYWLFPQDLDSERQLAREAGLTSLPSWPKTAGRFAIHIFQRSAAIYCLNSKIAISKIDPPKAPLDIH